MTPGTIDAVKLLISNRVLDLESLQLSWFGGEPLVAKDIVCGIQGFAQKLCQESAVELSSGMTTNGYLLSETTFRELVSLGIKDFQISIDGDPVTHDASRLLKGGRETFDIIWKNLVTISTTDLDFRVILRIHFTKENFQNVLVFCEQIKSQFGKDHRFEFFPKAISKLGGPNNDQIEAIPRKEEVEMTEKLFAIFSSKTSLVLSRKDGCYVCYAAKSNAFTIRSDGSIGKCTVALSDDRNKVGQLLSDGSIQIDNEKHRPWLEGIFSRDAKVVSCPLGSMGTHAG